MPFLAGLLGLYILCGWAVFFGKRFEPAFVPAAACVTALQLFQIYYAVSSASLEMYMRLLGCFLMTSLLFVLLLRPRRAPLWSLAGWLCISAAANLVLATREPDRALRAYFTLEVAAVASLAVVGLRRRRLLDPPKPDPTSAFD